MSEQNNYSIGPMGLPYIAHMRKDLSFEIVAAGHKQVTEHQRLCNCGLVWREGQADNRRWVEPSPTRHQGRIKTLPLWMVQPTPGLEIHALDGERYLLPKDFKGSWFDVRSPKTGKELIP